MERKMNPGLKSGLITMLVILLALILGALITISMQGCEEPDPGQHPPKPPIMTASWTRVLYEGSVYAAPNLTISISTIIRPNVYSAEVSEIDPISKTVLSTWPGEYHFISEQYGIIHFSKGLTLFTYGASCNGDESLCEMAGGGVTYIPPDQTYYCIATYKRIN